ncbi:MAG: tyrosine-type recombinase/integrase [Candidatus Dadabacteria bacterium]|nr:tyrosine-type recombinase/integrase [Gammaproteobacteria bacterium]NIT05488.1 tyrosine-type recombinase/integrase [Gammaproteobacteria bacterium]NIT14516.1 tyrosine-type recombinase/integrase [Candidatus Dadabacteria bacterium]
MNRTLPDTLNQKERVSLLSQPNKKAPTGLRDLAIIRLMLNSGLRTSEVLNIQSEDLDWMSGRLLIKHGKGKKDRIVWINEEDLKIIRKWKELKPHVPLLFTTLKGNYINDRYLRAMVKRRAKIAGIDKDVHPHLLRHTFATDLLKSTKNIRLVQKALGHASLSSTMIYTHVYDEELENALKLFRKD